MSCLKLQVIKNADMAEDMQQDAIDCATQALEKYNIEKDPGLHMSPLPPSFLRTRQTS